MGHRFLKHMARTRVVIHLIDSSLDRDLVADFDAINCELELFDPGLGRKPQIVAANKIDALDDPARLERLREHLQRAGIPLYAVSAATGEGLPLLLEAVWQKLAEHQGTQAI